MLKSILRAGAFAVAFGAAGAAWAASPASTADTSAGKALVNPAGMTLYVYAKDTDGKSACTDACTKNWPPFAAPTGASASDQYTVVARGDGTSQWAYKGKPLYTFAKDKKAGDAGGAGLAKGAWTVATP